MTLNKPIDIKISTVVAISVILHDTDNAILETALNEMTGGAPDFFDNEFAIIDVNALKPEQLAGLDWATLISLLKAVNLNPLAVRHAPLEYHAAFMAHGLSIDDSPKERTSEPPPARESAAIESVTNNDSKLAAEASPIAAPLAASVTEVSSPNATATMIIDTPVRAGQRIYARGADLIITAVVNNGAEVIADGSIHVYAPLRGRALAGASGNPNARIFALSMAPELLSINGMYRTFEDGFPSNLANQPIQAKLVGDRLDLTPVQLAGKNI